MKIDVLGTEYTIEFRERNTDKLLLNGVDGYCDHSGKLIVINTTQDGDLLNFKAYKKQVLRHEIIHAFLNESGLSADLEHKPQGHEESVVDWIAIQFPKLLNAFKEAQAI